MPKYHPPMAGYSISHNFLPDARSIFRSVWFLQVIWCCKIRGSNIMSDRRAVLAMRQVGVRAETLLLTLRLHRLSSSCVPWYFGFTLFLSKRKWRDIGHHSHISCSFGLRSAAGRPAPVFCRTSRSSPCMPSQNCPCRSAACRRGWNTGSLLRRKTHHPEVHTSESVNVRGLKSAWLLIMTSTVLTFNLRACFFCIMPPKYLCSALPHTDDCCVETLNLSLYKETHVCTKKAKLDI